MAFDKKPLLTQAEHDALVNAIEERYAAEDAELRARMASCKRIMASINAKVKAANAIK